MIQIQEEIQEMEEEIQEIIQDLDQEDQIQEDQVQEDLTQEDQDQEIILTTKQGRAQINVNYSMEGYEGENDRLIRQGNQGRLKIELEKVNIPTTTSDKYKFKSETEKVNIPTAHSDKNRIRLKMKK